MKAKYIILSLIAVLAFLVGCQKETAHYLDEVQVSSSYLAFPAEGGSVDVTVSAQESWTISDLPEWISVSAASGTSGESIVKFTTEAAEATREATFFITCGGSVQRMNALQMTEAVDPVILTVEEAIALARAIEAGTEPQQTVYVRGIVCRIDEISTSYGNATYYLSDDGSFSGSYSSGGGGNGNWFEVYRGYWTNGDKFTTGDEFGLGDELVVKGVIISYNGIPETNSGTAEVISIKKSLIGIDSTELLGAEEGNGVTEFPVEGGSIKVNVNAKGDGFSVVVPDEAKSWLTITSASSTAMTFTVGENVSGPRDATLVFSTSDGKDTYTTQLTLSQTGAIGTEEKPFSVTEAIAYIADRGKDTLVDVYVKGVVSKVLDAFSAQYGNASFWISEDGTFNDDLKLDFEAYRVLWLGNKKWAEGETRNVAVGDEVVLCGAITLYKNTAETVSGKAYVWSHNGKTE